MHAFVTILIMSVVADAGAGDAPTARAYALDPSLGPQLSSPCSRPGPFRGSDAVFWKVTPEQIEHIERAIEAWRKVPAGGASQPRLPLRQHIRQYVGITTYRGKAIYGRMWNPAMPYPNPEHQVTNSCDSGEWEWGIEFDLSKDEVYEIWVNGGGPK